MKEKIDKELSVNVLSVWKSDYDDYRALVEIGMDKEELGKVIVSYDENTIRILTNNIQDSLTQSELKNAIAVLTTQDFEHYISLPKTSEISDLLKSIYRDVCESDSTMCHITKEDWDNYYVDNYSKEDLKKINEEIEKYGLQEVIEIDSGEYKIIGYGDLETRFIDDTDLEKESDNEL